MKARNKPFYVKGPTSKEELTKVMQKIFGEGKEPKINGKTIQEILFEENNLKI